MAIDLDAIEDDLVAAGIETYRNDRDLMVGREFNVREDGVVFCPNLVTQEHWPALDIIRRHLAPPPHGPAGARSAVGGTEVRELVAKTAYEAFFDSSWSRGERSAETECWRNVADAVLAVLGLAGDREGATTDG